MVVIREATYTTSFEKIIYEIFDSRLPTELIDLVIQSTNYRNYIGRFGHEKVTHWTAPATASSRKTQLSLKWKKGNKFNDYAQYDGAISSSDSEEDSD